MMPPALTTQHLSIGYRPARRPPHVLAQGLALALPRGQLICLLGANGSGKSTLMRTLAGMQPPLAGTVLLAGDALHQLDPSARARRLSIVLTERPHLGLLNGYALVALGRHPHTGWSGRLSPYDEAMVRWAVAAVGAADLAERPVMELSDGQRQKLMIARALAQEAAVLLLDEPTAFLDLPRRVEIMLLLRQIAHQTGRAILLSTHDLDLALRTADALWLLAGGVIRSGTPEDLVLDGSFAAAFHEDGLTFDRASGGFALPAAAGAPVVVHGTGLAATWTRRALARAGRVALAPDDPAAAGTGACLEVLESATATVWHLHQDGHMQRCTSIGQVLAALPPVSPAPA
ncbi:MAG: ABC transporter ATP-binding protein [Anaerolineae bacterium]|nr:ABC transporter ATP-binding protein [Anaerolineae bacterium]